MTPRLAVREANHNPGFEALRVFERMARTVNTQTASAAEKTSAEDTRIYPSTAKNWMEISPHTNSQRIWTVYSLQGKMLLRQQGVKGQSLAPLPRGSYWLPANSSGERFKH